MADGKVSLGPGRYAADPDATCGQLLRRHRLVAALTQEELAERSGYSTDYISKLERDQRQPPHIAVDRLAAVLNLTDAEHAALRAACQQQPAEKQMSVESLLSVVPPPTPPTPLIGRTVERAAIHAALEASRLTTLTGVGGTGKTRLALHVAGESETVARFPHGVAFVNLGPIRDSSLFAPTIARALGLSDRSPVSVEVQLTTALRFRRLLLVIDNVEHLLEEAPLLGRLLSSAPGVSILATSRVPLHLYGEHEIRVPPLPLPSRRTTPGAGDCGLSSDAQASEAVQLFLARGKAAAPQFVPSGVALEAVADICVALDGLPLAIELAAARVNFFSPEAIRSRLGQRLALLTNGPLDLPSRHRTLRATLDWSYALLTSPEQTLFARLSVFEGSFDAVGAAAVCTRDFSQDMLDQIAAGSDLQGQVPQDVEDAMMVSLAALVDQSLVEVTPGLGPGPRFRLLETLREYATARLMESGEEESVRNRHFRYYLAIAEKAASLLNGPEQGAVLERLEAEHDNLRAALRQALQSEDCIWGLRLAGALGRFWQIRGHLREGLGWLDQALGRAIGDMQPAIRAARAEALVRAGTLARYQGDTQRATSFYSEALSLSREMGDSFGIARTLNAMGNLASRTGDYDQAAACYGEALTLWRSVGNEPGVAIVLGNLGRLALRTGDAERALRLLEETLAVKRQIGDARGLAGTLTSLGRVAIQQGEYTHAIELLEEGLALKDALGDRHGRVTALAHLGWATFLLGDGERARVLLHESLRLGREIGARDRMAEVLESLAAVMAADGQLRDAAWIGGAAHALRAELGHPLPPQGRFKHEEMEAAARAALGEHGFATAWSAGQAQDLDEVIVLILDEISPSPDEIAHGRSSGRVH